MNARWMTFCCGLAGLMLLALVGFGPAKALAGCTGCSPPPCNCTPPKPPQPPAQACCGSGGHDVRVPNVNVVVGSSVVVNATAQATVNAAASSSGAGNVVVYGGGGGSFSMGGGAVSVIQGLNVEGGARSRSAYNATRTKVKTVVIQAFCLDDREVPHPASQVSPDRDIALGFEGELYRCLAGTRMQITFADYDGRVSFDKGQTMMCAKGEALYYSRGGYSRSDQLAGGPPGAMGGEQGGRMECRPQKPARDCNERSLLRRFGAGVKILRIFTTETYTAYREESTQSSQSSSFNMSVDGGVGGVAY